MKFPLLNVNILECTTAGNDFRKIVDAARL